MRLTSFGGSTTDKTYRIDVPGGSKVGDLVVAVITFSSRLVGSTYVPVHPGWTRVTVPTETGTYGALENFWVFYKVLAEGDTSLVVYEYPYITKDRVCNHSFAFERYSTPAVNVATYYAGTSVNGVNSIVTPNVTATNSFGSHIVVAREGFFGRIGGITNFSSAGYLGQPGGVGYGDVTGFGSKALISIPESGGSKTLTSSSPAVMYVSSMISLHVGGVVEPAQPTPPNTSGSGIPIPTSAVSASGVPL